MNFMPLQILEKIEEIVFSKDGKYAANARACRGHLRIPNQGRQERLPTSRYWNGSDYRGKSRIF